MEVEWKMKRCRFLILAAFVATMPNMVYAQSICDTISTIAKNVSQSYKRSSREYLEFLTLPGATCNFEESDGYTCYWSKPHNNASGSALRAWSVNLKREAKIFTGRVKACLDEIKDSVEGRWRWRYKWGKKGRHLITYYFHMSRGRGVRKISILICSNFEQGGALVLKVMEEHSDVCYLR